MTARKKPALRHSGGRACVLGDLLLQLVVHNVLQDCGEGVERHGAEIAVRAVTRETVPASMSRSPTMSM